MNERVSDERLSELRQHRYAVRSTTAEVMSLAEEAFACRSSDLVPRGAAGLDPEVRALIDPQRDAMVALTNHELRRVCDAFDSLAARAEKAEAAADQLGALAADCERKFKLMREAVANDGDRERYDAVVRDIATEEAENARLRAEVAALTTDAKEKNEAIDALVADNARLREALRGLVECLDGADDGAFWARHGKAVLAAARAALDGKAGT